MTSSSEIRTIGYGNFFCFKFSKNVFSQFLHQNLETKSSISVTAILESFKKQFSIFNY